jgi:hypothetical protein
VPGNASENDAEHLAHDRRDFPLGFHKNAAKAHGAAHCAGAQGKYWEMSDQLFANQKALQAENLPGYAEAAGKGGPATVCGFQTCMARTFHECGWKACHYLSQLTSLACSPEFCSLHEICGLAPSVLLMGASPCNRETVPES